MNSQIKNKITLHFIIKATVIFLLFASDLCIGKTFAQADTTNTRDSLKKTVIRLNFISPGVSVEQEISFSNTIVAEISLYILPIYDSTQYKYYFFFYPRIKGEYRHYYNFSRRLREGKSINRFSGSYIGIVYQHLFGNKREPAFDQAGVVWGTQYVSMKKFHIGVNIGFGYSLYADPRLAPGFNFLGDLKIGYTF